MTGVSQEKIVLGLGGLLAAYWLQRATRGLWVPPLTRWLLRRGRVRLAMRLRFGKSCC